MPDALLNLDREWFALLNGQWHTPLQDAVLPYLRNQFFWTPVYVFLAVWLLANYGRRGWAFILLILIVFAFGDALNAQIIKPLAGRLRPCREPSLADSVRLLVDCGPGFSFLSNHATNHFALSVLLGGLWGKTYRWLWPVVLTWALLVAYAQVYVGLHYPFDVIGGALLGSLIGWSGVMLAKRFILQPQ